MYYNLIFIIPPATFVEIYTKIGEPKEELEKVKDYKKAIFWVLSRKDYQKINRWSKTISANINSKLTIKTVDIVRKIVGM